jgi:hypothetical protein
MAMPAPIQNSAYPQSNTQIEPSGRGPAIGNGLGLGLDLAKGAFSMHEYQQMKGDLQKLAPQVEKSLRSMPESSGVMLQITTRQVGTRDFSVTDYRGTNMQTASSPTAAMQRGYIDEPGNTHNYVWISNTCPADLPKGVGFMSPAQFENFAR